MKQKEKDWAKKLRDLAKVVEKKAPPVKPDAFGRRPATPQEVRQVITNVQRN